MIPSTIESINFDTKKVRIKFRIYHINGSAKDANGPFDGNFFGYDKWIYISSNKFLPILTFEIPNGDCDFIRYLIEELNYDVNLNFPKSI